MLLRRKSSQIIGMSLENYQNKDDLSRCSFLIKPWAEKTGKKSHKDKLLAKLNSNFKYNFNWVENSINFGGFQPPAHQPTRINNETPTSTSLLILIGFWNTRLVFNSNFKWVEILSISIEQIHQNLLPFALQKLWAVYLIPPPPPPPGKVYFSASSN